ncbi:MAG: TerB family tellurite resistance protein [Deltaproteobacteria bacterium]
MDPRPTDRLDAVRDQLLGGPIHSPDAVRAVLELALIMADSDGETSERETEHIVDVLNRLSPGSLDLASLREEVAATRDRVAAQGAEARLRSAAAVMRDPVQQRQAYRIVATVALVDGWLDRGELRLFNQLARVLGIPPQESTELVTEVRRTLFPEDAT